MRVDSRLTECAVLLSKVQELGDSSSSHPGGGQMPKVLHAPVHCLCDLRRSRSL
jgi:hypothetical protein